MPIRYALLEWFRAAELSCDRAAALLTRDPQAVCRALMVLSAGAAAEHLNLDAFIKQGIDYEERGTGVERLSRLFQDLNVTHPMPVKRVRELLDWVREGDYDRIVGGEYMRSATSRRCARRATAPPRTTATASRARSRRRGRRSARSATSCRTGSRSARRIRRPTEASAAGQRGADRILLWRSSSPGTSAASTRPIPHSVQSPHSRAPPARREGSVDALDLPIGRARSLIGRVVGNEREVQLGVRARPASRPGVRSRRCRRGPGAR